MYPMEWLGADASPAWAPSQARALGIWSFELLASWGRENVAFFGALPSSHTF